MSRKLKNNVGINFFIIDIEEITSIIISFSILKQSYPNFKHICSPYILMWYRFSIIISINIICCTSVNNDIDFFFQIELLHKSYSMVIYFDVDKILARYDFVQCYYNHIKWPWPVTHFVRTEYCYGCREELHTNNIQRPTHLMLAMTRTDIFYLLQTSYFWCNDCQLGMCL